MSNVIKARSVVMPRGGEPAADLVGMHPTGGVRLLARLLLDSAPLWHLAAERAKQELSRAQQEASTILEAARAEAETIRAQAWAEGHQAGLEAGREAGVQECRAQLDEILATVRGVLEEAHRVAADAARRHEEEIVQTALMIAARLARQPDVLGPETVRRLLEEVLPRTAGIHEVTIRLHPADLQAIKAMSADLTTHLEGGARVQWVGDERITRGGCLIETERGQLDARVETRLARIAEQLAEVVRGGD